MSPQNSGVGYAPDSDTFVQSNIWPEWLPYVDIQGTCNFCPLAFTLERCSAFGWDNWKF